MINDFPANYRASLKVAEPFGYDSVWLPSNHDAAQIKHNVQDRFSENELKSSRLTQENFVRCAQAGRPDPSGNTSIILSDWMAAPEAPLPRLSRMPIKTTCPDGCGITRSSILLVSLHLRGSKLISSVVTGSFSGCTRTNVSPS